MKEEQIIKKSLISNIIIFVTTIIWFEGLMGLNRKINEEYGYGGILNNRLSDGLSDSYTSFYSDFESVIFPICVILILLVGGIVNFRFYKKYISENWMRPIFNFDIFFRLAIIVISGLTIYQINLTEFWDEYIVLYRIMYLLSLVLPAILIYEYLNNKGKTVFPEVAFKTKQQSIYSEEKKLGSLNKMNIISDSVYSNEMKKVHIEKNITTIRNRSNYKEFVSNLDFAVSKGLLSETEKSTKLKEKEQELLLKYFR